MLKLAVLTKPRFSLLHLIVIVVAALASFSVATHWDAFMAGYRQGYSAASYRANSP